MDFKPYSTTLLNKVGQGLHAAYPFMVHVLSSIYQIFQNSNINTRHFR
jgi:hypothetical protein